MEIPKSELLLKFQNHYHNFQIVLIHITPFEYHQPITMDRDGGSSKYDKGIYLAKQSNCHY
jgi:hypothetical protein